MKHEHHIPPGEGIQVLATHLNTPTSERNHQAEDSGTAEKRA